MMDFLIKHKGFFLLLFFILGWILLILNVSPDDIVSAMGVEGGYLVIFLTAFIGVSGFASAPFYVTLVTLTSTGEFNIFVLALVIAPARAFGDSLFFFLGYKGHSVMSGVLGKSLKSFSLWINKKPNWMTPLAAYIYTSVTPLPQDILMIALGLGKSRFRGIFVAVLLGNATFIILISLLSSGVAGRISII